MSIRGKRITFHMQCVRTETEAEKERCRQRQKLRIVTFISRRRVCRVLDRRTIESPKHSPNVSSPPITLHSETAGDGIIFPTQPAHPSCTSLKFTKVRLLHQSQKECLLKPSCPAAPIPFAEVQPLTIHAPLNLPPDNEQRNSSKNKTNSFRTTALDAPSTCA